MHESLSLRRVRTSLSLEGQRPKNIVYVGPTHSNKLSSTAAVRYPETHDNENASSGLSNANAVF